MATLVVGGVGGSGAAWAQITGFGGTTGTTGGITASDIFMTVQKQEGVNLVDRDIALFLNQASCRCQREVFLRAVLLPQAFARTSTINANAEVSMYLGTSCNVTTERSFCLKLGESSRFGEFRASGITRATTVDALARVYARNATTTISTGTGGATGTGGSTAAGTGGTDGQLSGTGGSTATGSTETDGVCSRAFAQTMWIMVSSTGGGEPDIVHASRILGIDSDPPPSPTDVTVVPGHEALSVNWEAVQTTTGASDLLGYQLICTRTDSVQVFAPGTFTPAFDSCDSATETGTPLERRDGNFVCSDLLSISATSRRLKILQNGIPYAVGVIAIDNQRNASKPGVPSPLYTRPVATNDFYFQYRHGDPAGDDPGGFCAVADASSGRGVAAGVALFAVASVLIGLRRNRRSRTKDIRP